jgi:hypothetical protein
MDMHSGGGQKEKHSYIYIEAPEQEAKLIFYNRFGHNPDRVTCTCCGEDYSIRDSETFEQSSGYDRGCAYSEAQDAYIERTSTCKFRTQSYQTVPEYRANPNVLVIEAADILDSEREGTIPDQGYIWVD